MAETKKELGQHWLHDDTILDAIVESADISDGDFVLEIGPGLGTLTEKLEKSGAKILALEFDKDLIDGLNKKFNTSQVKIEQGDIRTFNFSKLPSNFKIVANIPYYLTSHLIRSISETDNPPSLAVLLVQKEVAERLCAKPGQMSILAVTAQFYFDCSLGVHVPAKFFTPPPKVDSQVVLLNRENKLLFEDRNDQKEFFRLVKAGFSEKRKTLRNSLSGGLHKEKTEIEKLLAVSNIDASVRAQELSINDWFTLHTNLKK